jgi:hypothetical protein
VTAAPVTIGAYAVSAAGRLRWGAFPSLHSDDKFVRSQFHRDERQTLDDCSYEVLLPASLSELVRARRRYNNGNRELASLLRGKPGHNDVPRHAGVAQRLLKQPDRWLSVAAFLTVHLLAAVPTPRARP